MVENGIINRFQLWLLVINFTLGSALLIIPAGIVSEAKQDAWLSILLAILIGSFILYIIVALANRYPDKTLIGITENLLGKKMSKLLGLIYAWYFLHLSALVIRNAIDFIVSMLLQRTPTIVFSIMTGFLLLLITRYGLEVIGRSNEVFSIIFIIGYWITILFVIPLMDLANLQPVLHEGIKPILRGTFPTLGFPYSELVVFLMILPFVDKRKNLKKIFISGGIVGGLYLFVVIISSILVLGVEVTQITLYPTYNMARLINIVDFITRLEAPIALSYIIIVFVKISVSFYGGILALSQVFNVSDYRNILFPTLIITISLSIILSENIVEILDIASTTWTPYSLLLGFIIPSLLLILSLFKNEKPSKR